MIISISQNSTEDLTEAFNSLYNEEGMLKHLEVNPDYNMFSHFIDNSNQDTFIYVGY